MKPAAFEHVAPRTIAEAIELLTKHGDAAKLLAGGQTLVPMMNFRLLTPSVLIDLNRIQEMSFIADRGAWIGIGAMTRHRDVERSELIRTHCPLLASAVPHIAHAVIRNRGTAGGSLAHADPAAEWPTVVVAIDAELVVQGPKGCRTIRASDFFDSLLTTALAPDEILVEIRLPKVPEKTGAAFLEVSRRHADFALVTAAAQVTLTPEGTLENVCLALGGVCATPQNVRDRAAHLLGEKPESANFEELGRQIAESIDPISDPHASSEYRRDVAAGLLPRALRAACTNVRGQTR
jgi:carbon-monoxide dehydrogenase medium subunit